jgi:hypothetical protein
MFVQYTVQYMYSIKLNKWSARNTKMIAAFIFDMDTAVIFLATPT